MDTQLVSSPISVHKLSDQESMRDLIAEIVSLIMMIQIWLKIHQVIERYLKLVCEDLKVKMPINIHEM